MLNDNEARYAGVTSAPALIRGARAQEVLNKLMRIELVFARIESKIAISSWIVVALAMMGSVVIRAFGLSIADPGELAIVAMSGLTFVGAALCSHLHKHITADIVEMLPRGPLLQILEGIGAVLSIVFGGFFIALSINLFDYALSSGERLIDFGTPIVIPVGFMLTGAILMTFHAVLDLTRACMGREPGGFDPW